MKGQFILDFYKRLKVPARIPRGIGVMLPWNDPQVFELMKLFYLKYYRDAEKRIALFGINPGRFGGGLTGIPFTDPVRLEGECHISNSLNKRSELSSEFMYRVIAMFGGPEAFYSRFYFTSVVPFGFMEDGKNLNYYDRPDLLKGLEKQIPKWIELQLEIGISRDECFCIGEGKNFDYLEKLNAVHGWFGRVTSLPHPRFIMQYKRSTLNAYLKKYFDELNASA